MTIILIVHWLEHLHMIRFGEWACHRLNDAGPHPFGRWVCVAQEIFNR